MTDLSFENIQSIATEQKFGWQIALLITELEQGYAAMSDDRIAYDNGTGRGIAETIPDAETAEWIVRSIRQATHLAQRLTLLVNGAMNEAVNSVDAVQIQRRAREIVAAYSAAMEWAATMRSASVHEDWRVVAKEASLFTQDIVEKLATLPAALTELLGEALSNGADISARVHFEFEVRMSNLPAYEAAVQEFKMKRGMFG